MKVSELKGAELDYWAAKAQGARFWEERRGEYLLCVYQEPGKNEPYKASRDWEKQAERYNEIFSYEDTKKGFYGTGMPRYSRDWGSCGPLIEKYNIRTHPEENADFEIEQWSASVSRRCGYATQYGNTPQQAICRAVVASVYGEEVNNENQE